MNQPVKPTKIDLVSWPRKDHFEFFSGFEEPFFGLTVQLDLSHAYSSCKAQNYSLSMYYLYAANWAANQVESFRYRIVDGQPVIFDSIHLNAVQLREDKSFVFTYIPHAATFEAFLTTAKRSKTEALARSGLGITADTMRVDTIHYSVLPWFEFSSLSHARSFGRNDSCPKISFGKLIRDSEGFKLPCSIHVHHALMDGYHVGLYVDKLQSYLNGNAQ